MDEADRVLRWDIMLPEWLTIIAGLSSFDLDATLSGWGDPLVPSKRESVGVGGVTVVRGVFNRALGGVKGRRPDSRLGIELFIGRSRRGGSTVGTASSADLGTPVT